MWKREDSEREPFYTWKKTLCINTVRKNTTRFCMILQYESITKKIHPQTQYFQRTRKKENSFSKT